MKGAKMKNSNFYKFTDKIKIALFAGVVAIFFVIGLLFFLRPSVSDTEKRELTKFPAFTVESFASGEWTSQISLWFADTFPIRELMISANSALEEIYGIRDEQVISGGNADDIPTRPVGGNIEFNPTDDGGGEKVDGMYVNGDTAYQLYAFNQQNSDSYVALINKFAAQVKGKATVYDMIVPLHYQIALSRETAAKYGASDCDAAINYMYSAMSSDVKTIDTLPYLAAHNDEYLYYRTDHHWTARGAYYAYEAFCHKKGITPTSLESYQRLQFDGFLGTLYSEAKQPAAMKGNPDYVEAFVPMGTNRADVYNADGTYYDWFAVVYTGADKYSAGEKYNCFIAGDQPFTEIHNPNINNGSSIVVVKESYGNAFVPFLVDSYEYVYVIDYRKWSGDLADFVVDNGVDDVLFLNVVNVTSTSARLNQLAAIIK